MRILRLIKLQQWILIGIFLGLCYVSSQIYSALLSIILFIFILQLIDDRLN